MKDRLTLENFKSKMKDEKKNVKLVNNLEFIKGGAEEYCHNGYGKSKPGVNFSCTASE